MKTLLKLIITGTVVVLFLTLAAIAKADEIKLAVGTTALSNIFNKITDPFEKETGIKLIYDKKGLGADEVFTQVDKGQAEGGVGGMPMAEWLEFMKEKNYNVADPSVFKNRVIGGDRVIVFMNKGIKIKKLTIDQIQKVFTGKVTNWKEVGGVSLPIKIGTTRKLVATAKFFSARALQGKAIFQKEMKDFSDGKELKDWVAATTGAAAIGPVSFGDATVSVPDQPEIKRPLTFITKGIPSEKMQILLKFISEKGDLYHISR